MWPHRRCHTEYKLKFICISNSVYAPVLTGLAGWKH
uniref:Uncharacterized protein n=1 Tax=Arundo donax TaxID=35708 RepID=A0A0A9EVS6_ARUDO